MNKFVVIAFLIGILMGFVIGYCYFLLTEPWKSGRSVQVGVFYYVWYDEGYSNRHWNDTVEWSVVDTPILGFYNSANTTVIKQHLDWFKNVGIDFAIISWWGENSYEDNVTQSVFSTTREYAPWMKLAIIVEAFNESEGADGYDFPAIFDYIYNTYTSVYNNIYMTLNNKPFLGWYNGYNMTGGINASGYQEGGWDNIPKIFNDSRFECRILGHNTYVNWYFCAPCSIETSIEPRLSMDGVVTIEPRYDDEFLGRDKNAMYDVDLNGGLYSYQWNKAINYISNGKASIVIIYSWNEFHERSIIEPHQDATAFTNDPYFLCNKTKQYITELKGTFGDS